jgi:cytochrome c peroxidase
VRRAAAALVLAASACTKAPSPPAPEPPDPLAPLRSFEDERRRATSFADQPVQDRAFGADPYGIVALPDGRYAGILRGRDALVVLDAELREVVRVPTVKAPSAIARHEHGVIVASEQEPQLAVYRIGDSVERLPDIPIGVRAVRDVVSAKGVVHLIDEHDDRLIELGEKRVEVRVPKGPIRLVRTSSALFVSSLIDHAISAFPLDAKGRLGGPAVTTTIDGPYWSLAADGDLVIAGGVEDHPLDRRGGFFGYVDSFVYGYRYDGHALTKTFALNVSEHGLIVPKAISMTKDEALITSYGGTQALRISHEGRVLGQFAFPPGASAIADGVAANPLLDAWVTKERIVKVADDQPRTERDRLGEALFFTGLMAPASSSEGAASRFSCETCHFEGYVDGRTHHTGRGDVHATTKPLVGLFNNRPHFTRALDPDLSAVAENEFRVAGAPSKADPHFALASNSVPWLGLSAPVTDQAELRRALMSFLMSWTHRTNPMTVGRAAFTDEERAGADVFRSRCESCHQARTSTDEPSSRVPFEGWEAMIFHGGPIVWASSQYEKTGVVPYVHDEGARTSSLRRLYKKRPYFTNGSAPDLETALRAVRFDPFSHAGADAGKRLSDAEIASLRAFLDLL